MTADEYREPPNFEGKNLVFDQFHPLDHRPYDERCRSFYPHGWRSGRHHISMWWDFIGSEWVNAHTRCRVGLHHPVQAWRGRPATTTWTMCRDCAKQLSEVQPI